MLRTIAFSLLTLTPGAAFALCEGTDLIDAMPDTDRAALQAKADAVPYPNGIYWQAKRGDQTITMFGTYHFRHAQTDAHLAMLKPEIDRADKVYLEMSNADYDQFEKEVKSDPSIMFITEGPTLPDMLTDADWSVFRSKMNDRGFPGVLAAKMKPIWAATILGIGPCETRAAIGGAEGIDRLVGSYSEEIGNASQSLENSIELFNSLSKEPIETQIGILKLSIDLPLDADDLSYTMRERYLKEEMSLLWTFARNLSLEYGGPTAEENMEKFETALLQTRNEAWVDLLLKQDETRIFAAFGAGHLFGKHGVLYLLEQEGYEITRLSIPSPE